MTSKSLGLARVLDQQPRFRHDRVIALDELREIAQGLVLSIQKREQTPFQR